MTAPSALSCKALTVEVAGRCLVTNLDLHVGTGEFLAVLGQNGSGKSLTLHTLAGLRAAGSGQIDIGGHTASEMPRQRLARALALLPQHTEDVFPATVMETVMIGRHPHIGRFQWESREDVAVARAALRRMGLADMALRDITTLSGGERRRLAIAQVLTQEPNIFVLDEPTNHLDPQHQLEVLELFRNIADEGRTVIATLHDVNLAARYADRCLLLFGDGRWELDRTDTVLNSERLTELYATYMDPLMWNGYRLYMPSRPVGGA